jgi:acetone carboxylase gamma subunit
METELDYPQTYRDFVGRFEDNERFITYLEKLRWLNGFICPECDSVSEPWYQTRGEIGLSQMSPPNISN